MIPKKITGRKSAPQKRVVGKTKPKKVVQTKTIYRKKTKASVPSEPMVRFVPLGGLGEVGRNMMFFEYNDEILIFDVGLQFPEPETPGIDYIIPNVEYLESKKKNIKAIILTHAHYDHIGALPHILGKLGNPLIYTTRLTKEIVERRQADFPNSPKPEFELVKSGEGIRISENFSAGFFDVVHNVPDGIATILQTPIGRIVHPGEFKFDYDKDGKPRGMDLWKKLGKKNIHTMLLDSTNAEVPGYSVSERVVEKTLENLFKQCEGRIIVGTFASLLDRIHEIIKIAQKLGRKVAVSGYSMKTNIEIVRNLGYMKLEKGTIVPLESIKNYRDDKILIMCTGAQGEPNASLMRIALGDHKQIRIKKGDAVVLSSSVIPGNERSVRTLKDNMARQGARIYTSAMMNIHSGGHAPQEELKAVLSMVKPKYFIPIHGDYLMRQTNKGLAIGTGIPEKNIVLVDNGQIVELRKSGIRVSKESVPSSYVLVDGLGVGDVGEVVLRDRRVLAEEGMLVVIATIDRRTGKLLKNPDIISRGFIYLRENQDLLTEVRKKIRSLIERVPHKQKPDADYLKTIIRDQIGQFLYNKTQRRPMILPVIIEI